MYRDDEHTVFNSKCIITMGPFVRTDIKQVTDISTAEIGASVQWSQMVCQEKFMQKNVSPLTTLSLRESYREKHLKNERCSLKKNKKNTNIRLLSSQMSH